MNKKEKKQLAQDLIMEQISIIGYGDRYEELRDKLGDETDTIVLEQMNRVAKLFGYESAWFS